MTDDEKTARKEKIKRERVSISDALRDVFGHTEPFDGLTKVETDNRLLTIDYSPATGVYLSFVLTDLPDQLSSKGNADDGYSVTGQSLQRGTKDFGDKVKAFLGRLGQYGIGVEYHAEPRRERVYAKLLKSSGFRQLPGKKRDKDLKSWEPVPGDLAAGSPMLARLSALEKRVKGLRDLPEPRPTKFQEADRYHSDVFQTQYAVGTASGGRSVYVWGDETPKGRFQEGEIPKDWLENPRAERGAVMGTPGQVAWELENCVGSFCDHGDETQQAEARTLVDQLLGSMGIGPEVERTRPPKFSLGDLPKPAPSPGTVPSSQSAPDSPSVPTAPAPAPTAALETVRAAQAIRALPPAPGRRGEAGRAGGAGLPGATGIPGAAGAAGASSLGMGSVESGAAGLPGLPGSPGAMALGKAFSWQVTSEQREGSEQLIAAIKELTQALREGKKDDKPGIKEDGSFVPGGAAPLPKEGRGGAAVPEGAIEGPWTRGFLRAIGRR